MAMWRGRGPASHRTGMDPTDRDAWPYRAVAVRGKMETNRRDVRRRRRQDAGGISRQRTNARARGGDAIRLSAFFRQTWIRARSAFWLPPPAAAVSWRAVSLIVIAASRELLRGTTMIFAKSTLRFLFFLLLYIYAE